MARWKRFIDTRQTSVATRPRPGQFISDYREDYALDAGRTSLTPSKLGTIYRQADGGDTRAMFEVFNAVEEDPHVNSVLSKRKRRVLSRPLEISPAIEDDDNAQKAADLCRRMTMGDMGEDGIENWQQSLDVMGDAIARGFSLQQIIWADTKGEFRPLRLERWPQRDCSLGMATGTKEERETSSDDVRVITDEEMVEGVPLEQWQWVLHVAKARNDALAKSALLRTVAWWWLFKHFSVRDWVIFCERYGMPIRVAKYPKGTNDTERTALYNAVMLIGKDAGAVIPEGAEVEFIDVAKGAGQTPYAPLVELCDFQISKTILGGTLTTESGEKGARSLGEVHERNEQDIAERDGLLIAATIRRDLLTPIVKFNLGEGFPIPKVAFVSGEQEPMKERAERDQILANIGLPMTKEYFYETYGITVPEEGDELIDAPAPAPVAPPPEEEPKEDETKKQPPPEESEEPVDEQMNSAALALAASIIGDDEVALLRDGGATSTAIVALAQARAKKKSQPWATPMI